MNKLPPNTIRILDGKAPRLYIPSFFAKRLNGYRGVYLLEEGDTLIVKPTNDENEYVYRLSPNNGYAYIVWCGGYIKRRGIKKGLYYAEWKQDGIYIYFNRRVRWYEGTDREGKTKTEPFV